MTEDCQKKATDLGFDLTKQFLTLAFGGIAFVVGLSFSTPTAISALMLWSIVIAFGVSVLLGLVFLMRGVGLLSTVEEFSIYDKSLTTLSSLQIVMMVFGTILLAVVLKDRQGPQKNQTHAIEIRTDASHSVTYPLDAGANVTVETTGTNMRVTTTH